MKLSKKQVSDFPLTIGHNHPLLFDLKQTTIELYADLEKAQAENKKYKLWVNDLQSGMYINCVYCGHRYGPRKNTPVAMADLLKEHIEQCPKHPLSQERNLRQIAIDYYEKRIEGIAARGGKDFALDALKTLQEMTNSYNAENPWLGITASVALLLNKKEKAQLNEAYAMHDQLCAQAELAECRKQLGVAYNKEHTEGYKEGLFDGYHSG